MGAFLIYSHGLVCPHVTRTKEILQDREESIFLVRSQEESGVRGCVSQLGQEQIYVVSVECLSRVIQ